MRRLVLCCSLLLFPSLAVAWNAAGHRLVASIAWQQLSPPVRAQLAQLLAAHPDHAIWARRAGSNAAAAIFAEASTWPDDIRKDPRFHDETRDPATPALPGLPDTARHKTWHYVDFTAAGDRESGEIDLQIERLGASLASSRRIPDISYALPWLLHLVADIHQPLHVGHADDDGGNTIEIENPFNQRQPFMSLHAYWDDLPGPSRLRGPRLEHIVDLLLVDFPPPRPGRVADWRDESHALLARVYPQMAGSLLPIVTEDFQRQARQLANRRLVDAGYRLGWLLEAAMARRVSRETANGHAQ